MVELTDPPDHFLFTMDIKQQSNNIHTYFWLNGVEWTFMDYLILSNPFIWDGTFTGRNLLSLGLWQQIVANHL